MISIQTTYLQLDRKDRSYDAYTTFVHADLESLLAEKDSFLSRMQVISALFTAYANGIYAVSGNGNGARDCAYARDTIKEARMGAGWLWNLDKKQALLEACLPDSAERHFWEHACREALWKHF